MELEKNIETTITKVKQENYKNYFYYANEVKHNISFTNQINKNKKS